jgi:hypothetical protein
MLIGSPGFSSNSGRGYVLFGGAALDNFGVAGISLTQGLIVSSPGPGSFLGYSVSVGGDVNGDGKADYMIGGIVFFR